MVTVGAIEASRLCLCGPVHLATDTPQDLDLVVGDAGSSEESSELSEDSLGAFWIEETDGEQAVPQMLHQGLNLVLSRWFGCGLSLVRCGQVNLSDQHGYRLRQVEDWKLRYGGDADDQVAPVEVVPGEAPGLVPEDERRLRQTPLKEVRHCLPRR